MSSIYIKVVSARGASSANVMIMAIACAFTVANIYYNQPLILQMGSSFGRSQAEAGLIATLTQLGYAAGLFIFVPLGDRFDRRRLIMILMLFNMMSLAGVAFAPSYPSLIISNFAVGLTAVSAQIIIPAISGLASSAKRGRVVGTLMSGMSAGLLFARTLSGFIGTHADWRAMFAIAVGIDAALMLVIFLRFPKVEQPSALPYPALIASLWTLIRGEPVLRAACVMGFFMFASFSALWSTLAALLSWPPYQFQPDMIGIFGFIGISGLMASPAIGRAVDRFTVRPILTLGPVFMCLAYIVILFGQWNLLILIIGMMLIDVGNRFSLISNQSRIYSISSSARSRVNTLFMTSYFLGGASGAASASFAVEHFGWSGLSATGAAFAIIALTTHLVHARRTI